ncbi:hypothetical protein [Aliidiomarina celeris]|uniref:hypothetical protein n=1 Tax=Aliidiomarina celeris TaxID=2249428 RepID=UPI000DEA22BA|nr:hypothetical protein [Aliidiomarina celeris]
MKNLNELLEHIDLAELKIRIDVFEQLSLNTLSYEQIQAEVAKVVTVETPEGKASLLQPRYAHYPKGTRFYRVRTLPADDRDAPLRTLATIHDCWEPTEAIAQPNRLNAEHESVLYTAPQSPLVAITELNIQSGELFGLVVYEALAPVNVSMIGAGADTANLTPANAEKLDCLEKFVMHAFTRPVGSDETHLFRVSQCLSNDYFNVPGSVQNGWCYPSATQAGSFNVCFPKGRRGPLKLVGVQVAQLTEQASASALALEVKVIAVRTPYGVSLDYHQVGTDVQKRVFPEISAV